MTPKSFQLSPEVHEYLLAHSTPPDRVLAALIDETAALGGISRMQVAPEQGALLTILTRLVHATAAVEVGTFTGYSSLCIASGLADGGRLLCCDVSEEWTEVARRHWDSAGVADRIDLVVAPAIDTLRALPNDPHLDLAFVDADKGGYVSYVDELVPRLRPGGLLLIDNVLWSGAVADPADDDPDTVAIRLCNDRVAADERLEVAMIPVADGLTVAYRRA
ncbi:MAG: O-methyltransferase [Acidimicrobiales bacterium]